MNRGYEVKMDPQAMQATGLGKEEVRPAMLDAMERLEQSIKCVERDLGGLTERLIPVSRPECEKDQGVPVGPPSSVPLVNTVEGFIVSLDRVASLVRAMTGRLEV